MLLCKCMVGGVCDKAAVVVGVYGDLLAHALPCHAIAAPAATATSCLAASASASQLTVPPSSTPASRCGEALKALLAEMGFATLHEGMMPLVIREHGRKYQLILAHHLVAQKK
jgi:hypothetical protein